MAAKNNDNNDNKDTLENNNDALDGKIQTEDEMEAEIAYLAANADRHPSKRRRNKVSKKDTDSKSDLKSEDESDSESSKSKSSSNKNKSNASSISESSDNKHSNGSNEKPDADTDNKSDDTTDKHKNKKITTTSSNKKKTSKARILKKSDTRAIIAVIASSIVIIIAVIAVAVGYVVTNANKTTTTGSSGITTVASSGLPADPTKSATEWLEKYFDEVSAKFPADTFTEGNGNLEKLMNGDDSIIPDSMKKKIITGTTKTGMVIDRNTLNSVSYVGLIMFANAYEKTKAAGTQLSGSALTSFDSNTGIAFIPVQAIVVSDQNIIFELKWNSSTSDWQLIGDSLGWQTYVMVKNQALASNNSSSSSSNSNSNSNSKK